MVTEMLQEVPTRHVGPVFVHSCTLFAETAPKPQVSISEMQDWVDPEALHCDSL